MKLAAAIGTAILSFTLGASSLAYAQEQHEQQEEQKDKPSEKKAEPEKPAKQEEKNAQEEKNTKPEEKNAKPEQQRAPEAKPEKQEQRASAGRIPADRYKANFGQGHTFRVNQSDYRNHRFQYGGYSFGFVGEWPSNWLYTQNVYVIDIDGVYYLCNPMYPGVNIELNVVL
ncbi:MAG: hypothetical protein WAK89_02615 [Candidatus Sulfotelmatobacter sp.]